MKTHENKNFVGISFPAFHHFPVLCNSPIEIHGEQCFRAIGVSSRSLILLIRCRISSAIYRVFGVNVTGGDAVVLELGYNKLFHTCTLLGQNNTLCVLRH
jgi:hypothetical protein